MKFLKRERQVVEQLTPGLDDQLAGLRFDEREARSSKAIPLFRSAGGGNLLIPREHGGLGAGPLAAAQYQRAIGSRAPSLAIASTMHHYKVATLARCLAGGPHEAFLSTIAAEGWLIASCGAEGRPGQSLFEPSLTARAVDGGLIVNGSKRPCCLTWSMGLLSMLIASPADSRYRGELLNVVLPADSPGIERKAFWGSAILAGAESDEVILRDAFVPDSRIFAVGSPESATLFTTSAFLWFELLASAAYLGIASGLVERALDRVRDGDAVKASLGIEMEAAMSAIERVADLMDAGAFDEDTLARMLLVRYAVQKSIARATSEAAESLGGMAFAGSDEVSYLLSAARALAFHPPSLASMPANLSAYLAGAPLRLS